MKDETRDMRSCPPKRVKRVWYSEQHFLSHGAYSVKNFKITFYVHPRLKFSDNLHSTQYSLIKAAKFLGKLRRSCTVSFFYLQFGSKYDRLCHAHIIIHSLLWFEFSEREATPPHVTKKNLLRTPASLAFFGCARGSGYETKPRQQSGWELGHWWWNWDSKSRESQDKTRDESPGFFWLQQKSTTNYMKELINSITWVQKEENWNSARQNEKRSWPSQRLTLSALGSLGWSDIYWLSQTTMHCGWVPVVQIPSLQAKVF